MDLDLQRRVAAAQRSVDRFKDKPHDWGKEDCGQMIAFHLRQLGIRPKIGKAGSYHSAIGAKRALERLGHANLASCLDSRFKRIPPASALVADFIELPADHELGAITIVLGNGRVLGYHEDVVGAAVLQPVQVVAAWRVRV